MTLDNKVDDYLQKKNLEQDKEIEIASIKLSLLKNSYLVKGGKSSQLTYVHSSTPGILEYVDGHDKKEIMLPAFSVTAIQPGIEARLLSTSAEAETQTLVFQCSPEPRKFDEKELNELEKKVYKLDKSEYNSEIRDHHNGKITIFNDDSRVLDFMLKKGKTIKSGWYTHAFKNQPLSIGEALWGKEVRQDEIKHYHKFINELYIILDGEATITADGKEYRVGKFDVLYIPPFEVAKKKVIHSVTGIKLDEKTKVYRHITLQTPSITNDKGERVNMDTKEGFDIDKLKQQEGKK